MNYLVSNRTIAMMNEFDCQATTLRFFDGRC